MSGDERDFQVAAGNGLLNRRFFLQAGIASSGLLMTATAVAKERFPWMNRPGSALSENGAPSTFEAHVKRLNVSPRTGTTGSGSSRTPIEHLDGIITPSRLHFERHHSGIPEIDPDQHRLVIHGLVDRPLSFDMESLARYPTVSHIQFLECSGNSGGMIAPTPMQGSASQIHGLVSASEWGGVPLRLLLEEAGVKATAKWIIADGADAAVMARSVPLDKILDDAIVALYQRRALAPVERLSNAPLPAWLGGEHVD